MYIQRTNECGNMYIYMRYKMVDVVGKLGQRDDKGQNYDHRYEL